MHLPTCVWAHTFVCISMCDTSLHFAYMRMSSAPCALFGMHGGGEPEGSQLSGTRAQTGWGRARGLGSQHEGRPSLTPCFSPLGGPLPASRLCLSLLFSSSIPVKCVMIYFAPLRGQGLAWGVSPAISVNKVCSGHQGISHCSHPSGAP